MTRIFSLGQLAQMQRLRHLHVAKGWRFQPKHSADPPHHLEELVYSFLHGEWLDVLRVRSDTDARAARLLTASVIDSRPRACWSAEGTLADVLDKLAELPTPDCR